jgi:hypothetical protein
MFQDVAWIFSKNPDDWDIASPLFFNLPFPLFPIHSRTLYCCLFIYRCEAHGIFTATGDVVIGQLPRPFAPTSVPHSIGGRFSTRLLFS